MKRWVLRLGLVGSFALAFGSCSAMSAEEVCEEHFRLLNQLNDTCGAPRLDPYWVEWEEGPCEGVVTTCASVAQVLEPREMLDGCFPALQDMIDFRICDQPEPVLCQGQYAGIESDRTTCTP